MNMNPRILKYSAFFFVLLCPHYAWANAGTPLIWAVALHLLIGNALLGVGEGLLIAKLFAAPIGRCILIMVPANYFSAWLGDSLINSISTIVSIDLNNGKKWLLILAIITYGMTLALEWFFVAACLRGIPNLFWRSIKASIIIQSLSYIMLFCWYWMVTDTSLYTKLEVADSPSMSLPKSVYVYFISMEDGHVYGKPLSGGSKKKIHELSSTNLEDRLLVRSSGSGNTYYDLVARIDKDNHMDPDFVVIKKSMPVEAPQASANTMSRQYDANNTSFMFGNALELGVDPDNPWSYSTGFWNAQGLLVENSNTSERTKIAFDTALISWSFRNAVHIPTGDVLFQLGNDQICVFDPELRKVSLLWHGRGFVPVIDPSLTNP